MGTRADFYVGKGSDAEWIGSVAYDGYQWEQNPELNLMQSRTEADFRKCVLSITEVANSGIRPEDGWPWPWDSSYLTDYQYWFDPETSTVSYGRFGYDGEKYIYNEELDEETNAPIENKIEWPDMKDKRRNGKLPLDAGFMVVKVD